MTSRLDRPGAIEILECGNGLVGGGTPIFVEDVHVANLIMGQIFLQPPDLAPFRKRAEELGFDPDEYIEAVKEVPVISRERLSDCLRHLSDLAHLIATLALERRHAIEKNHLLLKEIRCRERLERKLEKAKSNLQREVEQKTAQLKRSNQALMRQIQNYRRAQEGLEEQIHFLQSVMDAIPLPIFIKNTEGIYLECNRAFVEIKGMPKDQLVGRTVAETAPPETAEICSTADRFVFTQGGVHKYETQTMLAGDKKAYLQMHKAPFYDREGRLKGLVATIIDLTALKEKEDELRSAKALMERIFDSIDNAIILADMEERKILACNPAAERIFRYSEKELSGQPVWILHKDIEGFERFSQKVTAAIGQGTGFRTKQKMRRKDGSLIDCDHTVSFISDDEGNPFALVCMIQDITAHTKTQRRLEHLENQHELILTSAGEGIMGVDHMGRITFLNPAGEAILGYREEELLGKNNHSVLHYHRHDGSVYPEVDCPILKSFRDGRIHRAKEDIFWKKDGSMVWVEYVSTPIIENGNVIGAVITFQDITERKRQEEEREEMNRQLQEAQKMRAIGQLAGGVAHDFNNILTVIQGNAEIASMLLDQRNPLFPRINEIKKAAERASSLTRQLLAFSRRQPMTPVPVEINQLISDMLKMLGRLIGENIQIKTQLQPGLPLIEADPGQIEQVIMNLVVNAKDAMPQGGVITITTAVAPGKETSHTATGDKSAAGRFVKISVADQGIGMDQETMDRLFEPFFTTKDMGEGTGLGLSVVHGIVQQHNGQIRVESERGKGSTFHIYLPCLADDQNGTDNLKNEEELAPASDQGVPKGKILLVEDDPDVLDMAMEMLKNRGFAVQTAKDIQKALRLLEGGSFDLLFTDLVLPDGYGIELAEQADKLCPGIKILITTGYSDKVEHLREIQERGLPFIQKPYSLKELSSLLQEIFE